MPQYATNEEIQAASPNIRQIMEGTNDDITRWAAEAFVRVNIFCRQNFIFESQTTKQVIGSYHPTMFLPKVISGAKSVLVNSAGSVATEGDVTNDFRFENGQYRFRYLPKNVYYPSIDDLYMDITADWGYVDSSVTALITSANSLRSLYGTHIASTVYHLVADGNTVATSAATDEASLVTLVNELKSLLNVHTASTVFHNAAGSVVNTPDATDESSALALLTALKAAYNVHIADTAAHLEADTSTLNAAVDTPVLPEEIKIAFIKVTQRLALRDNEDDQRYHNAGFTNETWGDGYTYSLSNADLRALIHSNDAVLLWEHVHNGRTVS